MSSYGKKLPGSFYMNKTVDVARNLLGKYIIHNYNGVKLVAEITETEAYTGIADRACHSYGGKRTARTEIMYHPGGVAYIYLIYGMHFMLNVVTEGAGDPCAVLIRGARPVAGLDEMAKNRYGETYAELSQERRRTMLNGPAKLCACLGLTREDNGLSFLGERLYLTEPAAEPFEIGVGPRINIDYAGDAAEYPYRFFIMR